MAITRARTKKKTSPRAQNVFSFPKKREKVKNNFATSFEYGNMMFNIKTNIKGNIVKLNLKIASEDFDLTGALTLNENALVELHDILDQFKSIVRKVR